MEDEVKEDPTRPNEDPTRSKETMSTWKAGWVKKASGRFLASYKDRYIQVERTELVVYENEDLATYLEKVDLENYDKCHELRSAFTKKNRLVLIRAAKSGNKVHDVKFQAQNPEEKEAWIKAFSDGINRAKNKIFDEVKVDETSQLEHATRTRPKGNRNRRPPTRIHMKEVANVSSDGILRHDLDVVDASIPNGTHQITTDTTETPKKSVKPPMPPTSKPSEAPEECQTTQSPDEGLPSETEPSPQKVLKPPMPPSKEAETAAAFAGDQLPDETSTDRSPEKKVLKPPMPPSKEAKPTVSAEDQPPGETSPEKKVLKTPMPPSKEAKPTAPAGDQPPRNTSPEGSPEQGFESAPPPTPPGKPIGGSTDNLAKASQSSQEHRPPTPPSKDKKPTQTAVQESTKEASGMRKKGEEDEVEEKEEEGSETIASDVQQSSILEGAEDEESPSSQLTTPMTPLEVKVEPSVTDHPEVTTTTLEEETQKVAKPMAQEQESAPSGGVDISPNEEPQTMKSSQLTVTPSVQTPEPIKKSPGPPRPPTKKKPVVLPPPKAVVVPQDVHLSEPKNQATDKTKNIIITTTPGEKLNSITSPTPAMVTTTSPTEETEDLKVPVVVETKSEFPVVVLSLSDPEPDSSCSSPMSCHLSPEKKSEREEEKSVDSGQHSDIDVDEEWSESRDTLAASTAALMGSQAGLDALMDEDGDTETPGSLGLSTVEDCPSTTQTPQDNHSGLHSTFLQMRVSQASHCPPIPFKPLAKLMFTSLGDLLSEASLGENMKQPITDVSVTKATVGPQNLTDLENEVALKLENTEELLGSVVPKGSTEVGQNSALAEGNSLEDRSPEELLARAMEKLRKADQFLRQAKHIKDSKHSENTAKRNSW